MLAHESPESLLDNGVNFDFTCCIKRYFTWEVDKFSVIRCLTMPTPKKCLNIVVEICSGISLQTCNKTSRFRFINCSKYNKGYCIIPHAAKSCCEKTMLWRWFFSDSKVFLNWFRPCCIFSGMVSKPTSKMAEEGESQRWWRCAERFR